MSVSSSTASPIRLDQVDAALIAAGRQAGCNGSQSGGTTTINALDPAVTQAQLDSAVATAVSGYDPDYGAPNRKAAKAAIAANTTYLGLASPTAAQNTAQLKALTQQINAIIGIVARNLP